MYDFDGQEWGGKGRVQSAWEMHGVQDLDTRDKNNETTESSEWWPILRIEAGIYFPQGVARGLWKTEGNEEIAVINTYYLQGLGRSRKTHLAMAFSLLWKTQPDWPRDRKHLCHLDLPESALSLSFLAPQKLGAEQRLRQAPAWVPEKNNNKRGPTWSSTREGAVDPVRFHQGEYNKRLIVPASSPWEMKLQAVNCG